MRLRLTDKKHSKKGIISSSIGLVTLLLWTICVLVAALSEVGDNYTLGIIGNLGIIISLIGLIIGATSINEKDIFRLYPILGTVINSVMLIVYGFTYFLGL